MKLPKFRGGSKALREHFVVLLRKVVIKRRKEGGGLGISIKVFDFEFLIFRFF